MEKEVKIWYDKEGDYLEVIFEQKAGYFKETDNDAVMEKVDENALDEKHPISVSLKSSVAQC